MRRISSQAHETLGFWLFISPWVLGFLLFTAGPMVISAFMSLTSWDIFNPPEFLGLRNFTDLFFNDPLFFPTLAHTVIYSLFSVLLGMLLSLLLGYFLSRSVRGQTVFRILIFLPSVIPMVAATLLFQRVFSPSGPLNSLLAVVGVQGPAWVLDSQWALTALIIMSLWSVGSSTVLILAGMHGIPESLYEAAEIDGAGKFSVFARITVPMLSPVLFFNLIMGLIAGLQAFGQVIIMNLVSTGLIGGPDNAAMLMVPYLYNAAFRDYQMGYASAIAWVLFAIILALSAIVFRSSSLWVFYDSEVKKK